MAGNRKDVKIAITAENRTQRGVGEAKTALDRFAQAQQNTAKYRGLIEQQRATAAAAKATAVELRKVGLAASGDQVRGFKAATAEARKASAQLDAYKRAAAGIKGASARGSFAQFEGSISATRGVNALGDAIAKVAVNQQRLNRIGAYENFQKVKTASQETARGLDGLGDAIQKVVANQQRLDRIATYESLNKTRVSARSAEQAVDAFASAVSRVAAYQIRKDKFAAFDQVASGAQRAKSALAPLEAAQERVAVATDKATGAMRRQAAVQGKGDLASRITGAAATRKERGPLGLRPYELQNLGYQVNDLITQIASGTSPMQAFAQQGGQIAQIFPGATAALLRAIPIVAAVAAVFGTTYAAIKRVTDLKDSTKEFAIALSGVGEAGANAEGLARAAQSLDAYGGSLKDARASIKAFLDEGVDPSYFDDFGKAARDVAKVMGNTIPEASAKIAKAFTGNYEDIRELDKSFGFLTAAELKHGKAMFDSGKAAEARTYLFRKFEERSDAIAAKENGPWKQAIDNVSNAWSGFLDWLGSTAFIQGAIRLVDGLAKKVQWLTSLLPGANGAADASAKIAKADARLAELRTARPSRLRDALIRSQQGERDRLQQQLTDAQATQNAADPRSTTSQTNLKEDYDAQLAAAEKANRAGSKGADEAERRAKAQADFLADLKAESDERAFQESLIGQSERQQEIMKELREAELDAQKVGLQLTDEQTAAIRKSVAALYDAEQAYEGQQENEKLLTELARARGVAETEAEYVSRRAKEAGFDVIGEIDAATGDLIVRMTEEEVQYRKTAAALFKLNAEKERGEQINTRVSAYGSLYSELQDQAEFARDNGDTAAFEALRAQLDQVRMAYRAALVEKLAFYQGQDQNDPAIQAEIARLNGLVNGLDNVGRKAVITGQMINEGIAGVGANAFDGLARAIAEGTNAWDGFRDAFLQAAADFLRQIAQMIIQQAILNAIGGGSGAGAGAGGGGAGGGIASFISGLFRHDGGMVGSGGGFRSAPAAAFGPGTYRYHVGGVAGLKPGEIPAVLKRGEVVDPGDGSIFGEVFGGKQGGTGSVKIVNVFDPADMLDKGLATEAGEKVQMNFFRRNAGAIKAVLG